MRSVAHVHVQSMVHSWFCEVQLVLRPSGYLRGCRVVGLALGPQAGSNPNSYACSAGAGVGACRGLSGSGLLRGLFSGAVQGLSGGCKMVGRCQGWYRKGVFEFLLKLGAGLNRIRIAQGAGRSCLVIWAGAGRAGSGGAMRGGRPDRFVFLIGPKYRHFRQKSG